MAPLIITEALRYEIPKVLKFTVPYSVGITVLNFIPVRAYDFAEMSPQSAKFLFNYGFHFITLLEHYCNTKDLIFLSTLELDQFASLTAARMALNIGGLISSAICVGIPYYIVAVNRNNLSSKTFGHFFLKLLWSTLSSAFLWGGYRCMGDRYRIWQERKARSLNL